MAEGLLGAGSQRSKHRLRIACLGSGSRGNSIVVEAGDTTVLVDAGFSGTQLAHRLDTLGYSPDRITAVIVTHEHRDHTGGIGIASRRWGWALHLTQGTAAACSSLMRGGERLIVHERDAQFTIGNLAIRFVPTCHDASDPVAVHLTDKRTGLTAGVATDIGRPTAPIREAFRRCHFLVLESNHDEASLREAPYPWSLKQRIGGSQGHLSNRLAGELAAEFSHRDLGGILLAHLSEACNDSVTALREVERALQDVMFRGHLSVAHQDQPSPWFDVGRLTAAARDDGPQIQLFEVVTSPIE